MYWIEVKVSGLFDVMRRAIRARAPEGRPAPADGLPAEAPVLQAPEARIPTAAAGRVEIPPSPPPEGGVPLPSIHTQSRVGITMKYMACTKFSLKHATLPK